VHPGDFLDEVAYLLVVLDPEANDVFEVLRDEHLAVFPCLADDQVEGNVLLATSAPAIGLPTGAFPDGKRPPDETAVMDELSEASTGLAFAWPHLSSRNLSVHVWYLTNISDNPAKATPSLNANLLQRPRGPRRPAQNLTALKLGLPTFGSAAESLEPGYGGPATEGPWAGPPSWGLA
jgi:hypothetical protein